MNAIPQIRDADRLGLTQPPAEPLKGDMYVLGGNVAYTGDWSTFTDGVVEYTAELGWDRIQTPRYAEVVAILPDSPEGVLCVWEPGVGRYAVLVEPTVASSPVPIHKPGAGACSVIHLDAVLSTSTSLPTATVTLPPELAGKQILEARSLTNDVLLGYPGPDQISITGGGHSKSAQRILVTVVD